MTQYPTIVSTKRGVQPDFGSKDARSARTLSSGHTTALQVLKASADRCHTPKQFRELLDSVQAFIPYQKLSAVWGYDAHPTLRYVFNYGFPMGFTLVLLDGRVVDESSVSGMASEKTSSHGVRGRGAPPRRNLTLSSSSTTNRPGCKCPVRGVAAPNHFVYFAAAMASKQSGRAHLKQFEFIVPLLVQASQQGMLRDLTVPVGDAK